MKKVYLFNDVNLEKYKEKVQTFLRISQNDVLIDRLLSIGQKEEAFQVLNEYLGASLEKGHFHNIIEKTEVSPSEKDAEVVDRWIAADGKAKFKHLNGVIYDYVERTYDWASQTEFYLFQVPDKSLFHQHGSSIVEEVERYLKNRSFDKTELLKFSPREFDGMFLKLKTIFGQEAENVTYDNYSKWFSENVSEKCLDEISSGVSYEKKYLRKNVEILFNYKMNEILTKFFNETLKPNWVISTETLEDRYYVFISVREAAKRWLHSVQGRFLEKELSHKIAKLSSEEFAKLKETQQEHEDELALWYIDKEEVELPIKEEKEEHPKVNKEKKKEKKKEGFFSSFFRR